jgi:hypothetical protein
MTPMSKIILESEATILLIKIQLNKFDFALHFVFTKFIIKYFIILNYCIIISIVELMVCII